LFNTGNTPANLTSLQLNASGTGNDSVGVNISLYLDANNNGIVDGGDSMLTSGTYPTDNGTAVINFNDTIPAASNHTYLVVYSLSSGVNAGTYQTSITASTAFVGSNSAGAIIFSGSTLNSAVLTVLSATATPTNTTTTTATPTKTKTPTPEPTEVEVDLAPNPADGTNPVNVSTSLKTSSDVTVQIFTTAFRKVAEHAYANQPMGQFKKPVSMTDDWNKPLASGLYYVVINTSEGRKVGKLLLLR
jgi:hypothetical protein